MLEMPRESLAGRLPKEVVERRVRTAGRRIQKQECPEAEQGEPDKERG